MQLRSLRYKSSLFLTLPLSLMLTSCGGGQSILEQLSLYRDDSTGDVYVGVEAEFRMNQTSFPSVTLPIRDRGSGEIFGYLSMRPGLSGESYLRFDVNMSQVSDVPVEDGAYLPNGNAVPVGGLDEALAFRVADRSRVYVGYGGSNVMLGAAVVLDALDEVSQDVPNANIFFPIGEQGAEVQGLVGLFTGDQPGESGVGIFVDITRKLNEGNSLQMVSIGEGFDFRNYTNLSRWKQHKLYRSLHKRAASPRVLRLQ